MKQTPLKTGKKMTTAKEELYNALNRMAVEWPPKLPKPEKFPATLKEFFRLVINAKTPADCMHRLRQFLHDKMRRQVNLPRDAYWHVPYDQFTETERDAWAASQIQAIKDGDRKAGYFTPEIWLSMGSAYMYWWCQQKSIKASESAKKRKRGS
jgi:hypothetical protein